MAYQSAVTHSSLSRLAQAATSKRRMLEAVRKAKACIGTRASLDEWACHGMVAEPPLLHATEEQPAAGEIVRAERAEAREEKPAIAHRVIGFERFLARPGGLREEAGGEAVAFVDADGGARVELHAAAVLEELAQAHERVERRRAKHAVHLEMHADRGAGMMIERARLIGELRAGHHALADLPASAALQDALRGPREPWLAGVANDRNGIETALGRAVEFGPAVKAGAKQRLVVVLGSDRQWDDEQDQQNEAHGALYSLRRQPSAMPKAAPHIR